jgi:hypothetical protein
MGSTYETECSMAEIQYHGLEQASFFELLVYRWTTEFSKPRCRMYLLDCTISFSKYSKLGTESAEKLRILHDTLLKLQT